MKRREQILSIAAELFAKHGFHGVSISDLGSACGVSGPALYKHFSSKEALLSTMLVDISHRLLDEGRNRSTLAALVDWHVDFALTHPALIIVQDRDWASLSDTARDEVRALQREYVELWVNALLREQPELPSDEARAMVHAAFGLINSTPHSAKIDTTQMGFLLRGMALRALSKSQVNL